MNSRRFRLLAIGLASVMVVVVSCSLLSTEVRIWVAGEFVRDPSTHTKSIATSAHDFLVRDLARDDSAARTLAERLSAGVRRGGWEAWTCVDVLSDASPTSVPAQDAVLSILSDRAVDPDARLLAFAVRAAGAFRERVVESWVRCAQDADDDFFVRRAAVWKLGLSASKGSASRNALLHVLRSPREPAASRVCCAETLAEVTLPEREDIVAALEEAAADADESMSAAAGEALRRVRAAK